MNFSKKITAGAVALALGASAMVAPRATALPTDFVSPPGSSRNPVQANCSIQLSSNVDTTQPGHNIETSQAGLTAAASLDANGDYFRPRVSVSSEGQRILNDGTATLLVANESKTNSFTYAVNTVGKDGTVTDTAPVSPKNFTLGPGESAEAVAQLAPENSGAQTWAWTVKQPTRVAPDTTRVKTQLNFDVAPWPIETDNCAPILPSAKTSQPIIADGTEYDTGITVKNAAKDYERLVGTVTVGGKVIENAKVRVDASGKVYVTLPMGATGKQDDTKPKNVDVQLLAKPREATANSQYEAYNQPQVLRVGDDNDRVSGNSAEFTATIPVQQFKPEYDSPKTVKPGKSVEVELTAQPGQLRGADIEATYTVKNAPEGWTAELAADGTLKVTAPGNAKGGDTAEFAVEVAYPDGSVDTLKPAVKVLDLDATVAEPKYGETYGKADEEVTLEQSAKLPKGSTFTITPGQELGEWQPKVDETTGKITVTIPEGAKPGDVQTILIDVTYPDGSKDPKVPAKVTVLNQPRYGEVTDKPGEKVTLPQTGTVVHGSTFTLNPDQNLGGWEPKVDETTGTITVVIPEDAKPGTEKVILIDVKDPKSGKTDTVPAKVIVHGAPEYGQVEKTPGENVTLTPKKDNVPEGATYVITPGQDLGDWDPTIDPTTGEITVKVPEDAEDGDQKTINVTVTYPGGKTDTVPAKIVVKTPAEQGTPVSSTTPVSPAPVSPSPVSPAPLPVKPGESAGITPTIIVGTPDGVTYKLKDGWKVPEGWEITIDPSTGALTVKAPKDAVPGTEFKVPVQVTLPSGKIEDREIVVKVDNPSYTIGQKDPLIVYIPKGGSADDKNVKLPDGWTYSLGEDGTIVINVPETVEAGTTPVIKFPRTDGQGYINVQIDLKERQGSATEITQVTQVNAQAGSSDDLKKCFDNLSSEGSPLPWLIPAAILLGVGAPLAGAMGPEIGKAIANVSAQMNIDIPNPFAGIGGERRQSAAGAQLQAEIARLQEQFGPAVTQAGAVILALTALAATAGILYAVCTNEDAQAQSSKNEGSSKKAPVTTTPVTTTPVTTATSPTTSANV